MNIILIAVTGTTAVSRLYHSPLLSTIFNIFLGHSSRYMSVQGTPEKVFHKKRNRITTKKTLIQDFHQAKVCYKSSLSLH